MWKVIGASVTGSSHQALETGCQDASSWSTRPDVTCLAVADGAGSRPLSGRGAELAVHHAVEIAGAYSGRNVAVDPAAWLQLVFRGVREKIAELAAAEGNDVGDYATTLGVAILTADLACVGQVGDTIAVVGSGDQFRTLAPAGHGEYVNETTFVTDDGALEQLRVTVEPAATLDAVFLSTDGLRFKILADLGTAAPFAPFFEDLAAYTRSAGASAGEIRRFLAGLDDQSGDDKSLIAAVLVQPEPVPDQVSREPQAEPDQAETPETSGSPQAPEPSPARI